MKTLHLGTLEGPLLCFGGPYGNLQATQALRARAEELRIPPGNILCTGDVTAYCAEPNETCALLRDWGVHVLMGNCEESLALDGKDCGCGFETGSTCALLSESWFPWVNSRLDPGHRRWMSGLPRLIRFRYQDRSFAVIHGGAGQINRFIFASSPESVKRQEFALTGSDGIIAGHCGLPFSQLIGDYLWHNPGAIGMPANDGQSVVWYSLWNTDGSGIEIRHLSLAYDVEATREVMAQRGLNTPYRETLHSGLWPSLDILPEKERMRRGMKIEASTLYCPGATAPCSSDQAFTRPAAASH